MQPGDPEFAATAAEAFRVMMRRGWRPSRDRPDGGWYVSNRQMIEATVGLPDERYPKRIWPDPFTALVEADKWYRENVEKRN